MLTAFGHAYLCATMRESGRRGEGEGGVVIEKRAAEEWGAGGQAGGRWQLLDRCLLVDWLKLLYRLMHHHLLTSLSAPPPPGPPGTHLHLLDEFLSLWLPSASTAFHDLAATHAPSPVPFPSLPFLFFSFLLPFTHFFIPFITSPPLRSSCQITHIPFHIRLNFSC